ncbi:signal transduction histidine kinase [Abortiporus biennis]|nr:signal transduction histidine kinase [Abortiporus biennis]
MHLQLPHQTLQKRRRKLKPRKRCVDHPILPYRVLTSLQIDDTDAIDQEVFEQLLELDDDEEETFDFSWGMVTAYFQQAITTFDELDAALEKEDLKTLSSLGHFLKGSSAALGIHKVQATCEKIQHYGKNWDDEAGVTLSDEQALTRICTLLVDVKKEYKAAEKWLRSWYAEKGVTE